MTCKRLATIGLFLVAATVARTSTATSELHKNVPVGLVSEYVFKRTATAIYVLSISGTNGDELNAVIDVFSYPDRTFIGEARPGIGEDGSPIPAYLALPILDTDANMYVVVRALGSSQGSATLTVSRILFTLPPSFDWSTQDFPVAFSGNLAGAPTAVPIPSGLILNTHVGTIEENATSTGLPGTPDSILMVLEDDVPVGFDDDCGVARMSWLHLNAPCRNDEGHSCTIIVAQRTNDEHNLSPGQPGYDIPPANPGNLHATLAWDEDVHNGLDPDLDGVGNALEAFVGTDPNNHDTDGDGIPDGIELNGAADDPADEETPVNLTRFAYYGANPLKPDLFIEMDWAPGCLDSDPAGCLAATKQRWRFTQAEEAALAGILPVEIAVHIDGGHADPTGGTTTGDWGGAQILSDTLAPTADACTGMTEKRKGLFTHVLAAGNNPPQNQGRCSYVLRTRVSASAHELGHYLDLQHWGGSTDPTQRNLNCKYNYLSIMNYAFADKAGPPGSGAWFGSGPGQIPAFSHNAFAGLSMNDYAINERGGLGANPDPTVLAFLDQEVKVKVDKTNGYIDWNRSGSYEPGLTRGMLNAPLWSGGDCDLSAPSQRRSFGFASFGLPTLYEEGGNLKFAALTPVGTPTAAGATTTVGIVLGVQANLTNCDTTAGLDSCATFPSMSGQVMVNPSPEPGPFAPVVAGGLVVYAGADGRLYTFSEADAIAGNAVSVTELAAPRVEGDLIAVTRPSGVVSIYAPSGGILRRSDYDSVMRVWIDFGAPQYWANTNPPAPITTLAGIGLTWGYQRSLPGEPAFPGANLYAAIPTASSTGKRRIALARLDGVETSVTVPGLSRPFIYPPSEWVELPTAITGLNGPMGNLVASRVGLAFRPEDPAAPDPKPGRFYITWQQVREDGPPNFCWVLYENQPMMSYTMGNVYSDSSSLAGVEQSLVFNNATQFDNAWSSYTGGTSILYFAGGVRGMGQTNPEPKVGAQPNQPRNPNGSCPWKTPLPLVSMTDPKLTFHPNIDGIFNADQLDFDDVTWMKAHLAWALTR